MSMDDDLAKKIKALHDRVTEIKLNQEKKEYYSAANKIRSDTSLMFKFLYQLGLAFDWILHKILHPVWKSAKFLGLKILNFYIICIWNKFVYRKDVFGNPSFSKTRAGILVLITFLFVWKCFFPLVSLTYDTGLYMMTAHVDEHVILLGSQEIDSNTGQHTVEGCYELPCSDTDAVYFRTEDNLFNNLWSIFHGRGLFYPEYVGGAVPYSTSKCVVTAYGIRKRFPFRIINMYSDMLSVVCHPV